MSVISRKPSTVGYCATRTISLPQKKAKVELSTQDIFERMAKSPTKLYIVILDACRDDPERALDVTRNALLTK